MFVIGRARALDHVFCVCEHMQVRKVWLKATSSNANHQDNDVPKTSSVSNDRSVLDEDMSLDWLFDPSPSLNLPRPDPEATDAAARFSCESHDDAEVFEEDNESDGDNLDDDTCHVSQEFTNEMHEEPQKIIVQIGGTHAPTSVQGVGTASHGEKLAVTPPEQRMSSETLAEMKVIAREKDKQMNFWPVTMELTVDSIQHLLETAERDSQGAFQSWQPFGVVGLHACGDLASTALKLFAEVRSARAVCVVGCCYHHITERDEESECVGSHGDNHLCQGVSNDSCQTASVIIVAVVDNVMW